MSGEYWVFNRQDLEEALAEYKWQIERAGTEPMMAEILVERVRDFLDSAPCVRRGLRKGGPTNAD